MVGTSDAGDIGAGCGGRSPADPTAAGEGARGGDEAIAHLSLAKRILRDRRLLTGYFDAGLFADPALDILLDLFVAAEERRAVCVSNCCIAASVPATTALRWIETMKGAGLLTEARDPVDRRRRLVALTPAAHDRMVAYLNRIGPGHRFAPPC